MEQNKVQSKVIINLAIFGHGVEIDDAPINLSNVRGFSLCGAYGVTAWAKIFDPNAEYYYTEPELYELLLQEVSNYNNYNKEDIDKMTPTRDIMYNYADLIKNRYEQYVNYICNAELSEKTCNAKEKRDAYRTLQLLDYSASVIRYNKEKTFSFVKKNEVIDVEFLHGIRVLSLVREDTFEDGRKQYIAIPVTTHYDISKSDDYNAFLGFLIYNISRIYNVTDSKHRANIMKMLKDLKYTPDKMDNPEFYYNKPEYEILHLTTVNRILESLGITYLNIFDFTCTSSTVCGSNRPCNTLTVKRELIPRLNMVDDVVWNGGLKKYLKKSRNKKHKKTKSMKRKTLKKKHK